MSFKFHDLMVDIVPKADIDRYGCYLATACPGQTYICRNPTFKLCPLLTCRGISIVACEPGTRPHFTDCGGTIYANTTVVEIDPHEAIRDLATLKLELHAAVAQVEAQEKFLRSESGLQSRAQAEALEQQLQGALREVQAQKEKLK